MNPSSQPNTDRQQSDANDNTAARHAIVTGGTHGIGLAIATGLGKAGWTVTSVGIDPPSNDQPPAGVSFVSLDVSDTAAVQQLVQQTARIDALVNAAGVIARQSEFDIETFRRVVDINLTGTMIVSQIARPKLAVTKGSIVNIASMLSFFGGGLVPGYSASKGGVVTLTKSLAIAFADDNIRVNAIAPGWITTRMTQALRDDDARNQSILERTPLGRWGDPTELVGPVLFLTSSAASFITGAILTVDGGYSCV